MMGRSFASQFTVIWPTPDATPHLLHHPRSFHRHSISQRFEQSLPLFAKRCLRNGVFCAGAQATCSPSRTASFGPRSGPATGAKLERAAAAQPNTQPGRRRVITGTMPGDSALVKPCHCRQRAAAINGMISRSATSRSSRPGTSDATPPAVTGTRAG